MLELVELVGEVQKFSWQGDYFFDFGIGQLIQLWGFQFDEFRIELLLVDDIKNWLFNKFLIVDVMFNGIIISSCNLWFVFDFGGYLKGVVFDCVVVILCDQGIYNVLINIGGNVMVFGSKEGCKWKVGIQYLCQFGLLVIVEFDDGEVIGILGDYQCFFEVDGKCYLYLFDLCIGYLVDYMQVVIVVILVGFKVGILFDVSFKLIFIVGLEYW